MASGKKNRRARFPALWGGAIFAALFLTANCDEADPQPEEPIDCGQLPQAMVESKEHVWEPLAEFRLLASECADAPLYNQHRAQLESFVGNHREALDYWDRNYSRRSREAATPAGQQDASLRLKAKNAISYIVDRSTDHQMVIVNERHHVSSDRLFTLALLEPLAELGFRYLAVEAVWPGADINQRGYPTGNTGYYINDVVYAEMLRAALSLGYEIVWYEIEKHQKNTPDSRSQQARRDYWQARNLIERTLDKDSDAQVLVHCGWGHVRERVTPDFRPMASYVRELAGIDPLTISQTRLSERSELGYEHRWRAEARRIGLIESDPVVLLQSNDNLLELDTGVDVHVLSPRTRFRDGRPAWMEIYGRRSAVVVAAPECAGEICIVEARNAVRPDEVAYDRVEAANQESVVLYLPDEPNVELLFFGLDGRLRSRRKFSH